MQITLYRNAVVTDIPTYNCQFFGVVASQSFRQVRFQNSRSSRKSSITSNTTDQMLTETVIGRDSSLTVEDRHSAGTSSPLSLSVESDYSSQLARSLSNEEIDSGLSGNLECTESVCSSSPSRSLSSSSVSININEDDDDHSSWSEADSFELDDGDELSAGDGTAAIWKRVFLTLRKVLDCNLVEPNFD
jgi:hypothetical protein